jgi:hypothetical protein
MDLRSKARTGRKLNKEVKPWKRKIVSKKSLSPS